jgi:alpha-glucosidase (family GH31 glycosyl hydrolase)
MTSWSQTGTVATFCADDFRLRIRFVDDRTVRVDVLPFSSSRPESSVVVLDTSTVTPAIVTESDSTVTLSTGALTVSVRKQPLRLQFQGTLPGSTLIEPPDGGASALGDHRTLAFALSPFERIYGSGPRSLSLDLRGRAFDLWNTQSFGYGGPIAAMNANVPLFLFSTQLAVFIDHWYRGHADIGSSVPDRWTYDVSGGEITYYVMAGTYLQELLDLYTRLTGRPPLPPRWSLGYIQSKFGYQFATEAQAIATTFRALDIPADGLVLDLYWFRKMGDLSWDLSSWPDPAGLLASLKTQGFKIVLITEPYVVENTATFTLGTALGHFGKDASGSTMLLPNWWSCNCNAALVDLTSPAARAWWWSMHPGFLNAGVAGIWTDLGEPEQHPEDMVHALGTGARVHNLYNLLWARTIDDGWRAYRPTQRLFHLTRSGWAGIQRYGTAQWSGDVAKSFGGLSVQPNLILTAGLSGLGWYHSDISGFCCGTSPTELYIRWLQLGTFSPVMRAHGTGGPTEPWGVGDQALAIARDFIRLRYRLLPYLYSLAHEYSVTGVPPVRPLLFADPSDAALSNESRAWFLGNDVIVAPVVQDGARSVTFHLPAGDWVDWWNGSLIGGGHEVTVAGPLERIPVFVRSGSILPLGPVMRWSDERPLDTLTLVVFPDARRSAATAIYEDDGVSTAYRLGASNTISIEQGWADISGLPAMVFQYTSSEGIYAGKPSERTVILDIRRLSIPPLSINVNGRSVTPFASWDDVLAAGEGGTFAASENRLRVQFRASGDSAYQVIMTDTRLTAVETASEVPHGPELEPNYPNPFNGETKIGYRMQETGWVKIAIVDVLGRTVAVLEDGIRGAGTHNVSWNAGGAPSGVYFCKLQAGGVVVTRRMVLIR